MIATKTTAPPKIGEVTGKQTVITTYGGLGALGSAQQPLPASYDTYREIRKDPTVALARALSIAPILAAEWSVEADEQPPDDAVTIDDAQGFIKEQFLPTRELFLERALFGGCDFGHQPFEKVFEYRGGRIVLKKLKALLQDKTEVLVDEDTGAFRGFRQKAVDVPLSNCLLIPFRVEGTNWYGEPLLENAREPWNQKKKAAGGAERYDEKVAGAHWEIKYPIGESADETGTVMDNGVLANKILNALESSGSFAIPHDVAAYVNDLAAEKGGWQIRLLADSGARQPSFITRLDYLDKQLARALILPERSVLEGTYGTKAEAEAHGDLALTNAELTHDYVTRLVNWHAVDQLLALNFGDAWRGVVRLVASPIVDERIGFLKEVYQAVLTNPSGFLEEYGQLDTGSMKELLGVPKSEQTETGAGGPSILPIEGVEGDAKLAASIRRMYRGLGIETEV